jgi:hypothetical protein
MHLVHFWPGLNEIIPLKICISNIIGSDLEVANVTGKSTRDISCVNVSPVDLAAVVDAKAEGVWVHFLN